jgi:hypothetical protein
VHAVNELMASISDTCISSRLINHMLVKQPVNERNGCVDWLNGCHLVKVAACNTLRGGQWTNGRSGLVCMQQ